jgi:putative ABC transport system permease protein
MGVTLLRGRAFLDSDNKTSPRVAIVNQTMASTFWPQEDPIGKLFRLGSETAQPVEVVGVAGNGKYLAINEDSLPFFYVPLTQDFVSPRALQIRAFAAPESLEVPVKEQIGQLAPGLSIIDIETMNQSLQGGLGYFAFRVSAVCAALLGTVGLILAVVGVYGVVSFAASQRTREIGIRLALGASMRDILGLIWKQGVRLVTIGVAVGMFSAWLLARTMTHLLVAVSVSDPVTYIAVAILLSFVGLVACWIPARRAMRVDPMVALRHE